MEPTGLPEESNADVAVIPPAPAGDDAAMPDYADVMDLFKPAPEAKDDVQEPEPVHEPESEPAPEPAPEPEATIDPAPAPAPTKLPQTRDISQLPPELAPHARQMSNAAFAALLEYHKAREAKLREAETSVNGLKNATYYQHPEAYKLTPEYTKLSFQANQQSTIQQYWQQALATLEEGQPIRDLVMDKDGNLSLGQELQPSPALKASVMNALSVAISERGKAQGQLEAFSRTYSDQYRQFDDTLGQIEQTVLDVARKDARFKAEEARWLQSLPPGLGATRYGATVAGLAALVRAQNRYIAQLKGKAPAAVAQAARRQGPAQPQAATSGKSGGTVSSLLAEFDAM